MSVIVDNDTGRLVWAAKGHGKAVLGSSSTCSVRKGRPDFTLGLHRCEVKDCPRLTAWVRCPAHAKQELPRPERRMGQTWSGGMSGSPK